GELAGMREEALASSEKVKQLSDAQQTSSTQLSGLNERMVASQASLNTLTTRVDRKRMDFKLPTRRTEQIASGISLTLTRADPRNQEVDVTLQLGAEGMQF